MKQNFQNSFDNVSGTLKKSVEMMKSMNKMMEELLLQNIHISHSFTLSNGGDEEKKQTRIVLRVEVVNSFRVSIPNCSFTLESRDQEVQIEQEKESQDELFHLETDKRKESVFFVRKKSLMESIFEFSVSFPSPGTGETLKIIRNIRIGFLNQMKRKTLEKEDTKSTNLLQSIKIEANKFRKIFNVLPSSGLLLKKKLYFLSHSSLSLLFSIEKIVREGEDFFIEASIFSEESSILSREIADKIRNEMKEY